MKRAISMLVAIVMVLSMVPAVFAASETATVLTDISEIAVSLNEDNGYYAEYSWTPSEDGELSLYQYTEKDIEVILTQGENTASSYTEAEDGTVSYGFAVSLEVVANEEVTIEVLNSVEETEEFTVTGSFVGTVGKTQDNPIMLNALANTVSNTGTLWYGGYFSGMIMTVTGEGDFSVTNNGEVIEAWMGELSTTVTSSNPRMPVTFAITGEGEFTVNFTYPEGSYMNPAELYAGMANYATIEAGSQGYYYTWTAPAAGTLTLEFYAQDADWNELGWSYTVNNMTSYVYGDTQWSDSDPIVNPAEITVAAGDQLEIVVNTYDPANMWSTPAGEVSTTATFVCTEHAETEIQDAYDGANHNVVCVACGTVISTEGHTYVNGVCDCTAMEPGTEANPMDLTNDLLYDGDFQATVTVPAGTTLYCQAYRVGGMYMTINNGEAVLCETMGMFAPYTWTLVNDGTEAAEYVIQVAYPVGTQGNPEIIFRPAYISVNIAEGNDQGYYYKWTSNADGTLVLTCPTVEGVEYDVNMTNMSTYAQVWLQDSTDGTISLAVSAGDEVVIQVAVLPDENWNIAALSTALTGEFIYPIGTQMNPEIIFRPAYIQVNIAEGNSQGYFYKWTSNADGTLVLTCPTVEGVEYDVNMTNMSTYAQAWLVDSTDGTISLDVKSGDEVVIQVAALPDASWNYPALSTALTGEFIFPLGSMMNPEKLDDLSWYYGNVEQAEGDTDGYYYTWTAPADGTATFYFGYNEGLDNYILDIIVTNQMTYAQKSLLNDGVDNYGMELQIAVSAGDELTIQIVAIEDAEGNYAPAANMTWCGNFAYPAGSEQNPIIIEWNWDDAYTNATASVTVAAGETVYFNGQTGMILTVNGVETEQNDGVFAITNSGDAEATYELALATPLGAYGNPESIELPFEDTNSLAADASYYYIWTATEKGTVTLTVTDGANITVDKLTYTADSEWPISEQFTLAEPEIDENWNYIGWIVQDQLVIDVVAGQQLKIQVNGLTDWTDWSVPAIEYTLNASFESAYGVTAQPEAVTAESGTTATFTVTAKGEPVSYQWQYRRIYKWFNTEMSGYNTDTLTVNVTGARNGYDYRCMITYADGTVVYSEPAELAVPSTIVITDHPNDQAIALTYKAQFTVAVEGEGLKYQWQYQRPDGTRWMDTTMDGYNKPTVYVETTAERDGYKYRCMVKDATGAVEYTEPATMTVLYYTAQPEDVRTSAGASATFSVETNAAVVRYEWQYSKDGVKWFNTSMSGYNTATLTVEATTARNGYQYRCIITGAKDSKLISDAATLNVGEAAVILTQPEDKTVEAGGTAIFVVYAENVQSHQWQYSTNGGTSWRNTSMSGYDTNMLAVNVIASRNGYQYRCAITGDNGEVIYSDAATLTVG